MAGAPKPLNGVDLMLVMQPYLNEPPILAQTIRGAMGRARAAPAVQEAVRFLEGVLGAKLTFTMADVAPLARVLRHRVGLKGSAADASRVPALKYASVYGRLLGEAYLQKLQVDALIALMRAGNRYVADARAGPPTALAQQIFELAKLEDAAVSPSAAAAQPIAAAGDSKDLYVLMTGSMSGFSEGQLNLLTRDDQFAAVGAMHALIDTSLDGKEDLDKFIKNAREVIKVVDAKVGKEYDFVQPRQARRLNKKFEFIDRSGNDVANLDSLAAGFAAHGRLFVRVVDK